MFAIRVPFVRRLDSSTPGNPAGGGGSWSKLERIEIMLSMHWTKVLKKKKTIEKGENR